MSEFLAMMVFLTGLFLIVNPDSVDNFPNQIHRTQPASEADTLRFELCPIGYVSSDEDLRLLCEGVK